MAAVYIVKSNKRLIKVGLSQSTADQRVRSLRCPLGGSLRLVWSVPYDATTTAYAVETWMHRLLRHRATGLNEWYRVRIADCIAVGEKSMALVADGERAPRNRRGERVRVHRRSWSDDELALMYNIWYRGGLTDTEKWREIVSYGIEVMPMTLRRLMSEYENTDAAVKAIGAEAAVLLKARHMGPSGRGRVKSKLRTK